MNMDVLDTESFTKGESIDQGNGTKLIKHEEKMEKTYNSEDILVNQIVDMYGFNPAPLRKLLEKVVVRMYRHFGVSSYYLLKNTTSKKSIKFISNAMRKIIEYNLLISANELSSKARKLGNQKLLNDLATIKKLVKDNIKLDCPLKERLFTEEEDDEQAAVDQVHPQIIGVQES